MKNDIEEQLASGSDPIKIEEAKAQAAAEAEETIDKLEEEAEADTRRALRKDNTEKLEYLPEGMRLHRVTGLYAACLLEIGSPFAVGIDVENHPNMLLEVGKFLAIMSGSEEEAEEFAFDFDSKEQRRTALRTVREVNAVDLEALVQSCISHVEREKMTQVSGSPPSDGAPAKPPRGKN